MKFKEGSLFEAAANILEKVVIEPVRGYGKEVPKNIQDTLSTILNSVVDKQKKISNAKFFDSGNLGVSFDVAGAGQYYLMMKNRRMGSDDIVRGNITLQKKGEKKPILTIMSPDSLNGDFPSMSDLGKMTRAVSDLL